ncbi:TIM22-1 [Scenedesmus sp. PABB004]|nr:TIM22-1 [Scenedesmus sp. PABB004]
MAEQPAGGEAAAAAAPADAGVPAPAPAEEAAEVNPMLQTSLTRRFQGRFKPMVMPTYDLIMQEDMMNNCGVRSVIAGVMGACLGVAFGVFTASLDTQGIDAAPLGEPAKPTRVVLRETWMLMREKSRSYAKGFGGMGLLYSGTECVIERYRARHDAWNATLAGCATGGLMATPGGPKAMCLGCASFAAFSTAIEYFTGGH